MKVPNARAPLSLSMLRLFPSARLIRPAQQSFISRKYTTNASTEELVYPEPQTTNHDDLPSFLQYASRIDMDTSSSTYVGTHYEYIVQTALSRLGMSLKRIGGRSDYGTDLLGTWSLPSAVQPLKVLIQCKALARKLEPSQARELEGAFVGAPTGWRGAGVLGFLVSTKPATKGVREALGRSMWPMGYVLCEDDGRVLQMLWNRKAGQEGLEGIGVETKYGGGKKSEREVVLTWKGNTIKG
jgi:hypothetical protein